MTRRSPITSALVTSALLVVAGFVVIGLGQRVVARTLDVPDQLAAVVSGGFGGLALIAVGCGSALVQVGRWVEDTARSDTDRAIDLLAEITVASSGPRR